jgi:hypothetical protein
MVTVNPKEAWNSPGTSSFSRSSWQYVLQALPPAFESPRIICLIPEDKRELVSVESF